MPVAKLSLSLDEDLAEIVREAAAEEGASVSAWMASAATTDVVDASIVDVAADGDEVLTTDPDDIGLLASAGGRRISIITI